MIFPLLFWCCCWIRDPGCTKIRIRDKNPVTTTLIFAQKYCSCPTGPIYICVSVAIESEIDMENVVLWGHAIYVSGFLDLRQKLPVVVSNDLYFLTWLFFYLLALIRIRFEAKSNNGICMLKIFSWPVLRTRDPVLFWVWSWLKILKLFVNWLKSFSAPVQKWKTFIFLWNLWLPGYFWLLLDPGCEIRVPRWNRDPG